MKKVVAIMTGLALSGSIAMAQEQETQDYDPNRDIVTETERDRSMGMERSQQDTPVQSEYGTEPETQTQGDMSTDPYGTQQSQSQTDTSTGTQSDTGMTDSSSQSASTYGDEIGKDVSEMSADKLSGKSVTTSTGEEIGEIDEVGYSATHQERVAVIEAGGFLGVGQKRIAVPLSELQMGTDDNVQTTLSRESIESQEEFDDANFTPDEEGSEGMQQ